MSCNYKYDPPCTKVKLEEAMTKVGVTEILTEDTTDTSFCLTDGNNNYVWAYHDNEGGPVSFIRFGGQDINFLYELANELESSCWGEHEEPFNLC